MLEAIGNERTGFLVLINIIIMICAYMAFRPVLSRRYSISAIRRIIGFFIIFIFCIFAFWGNDWFHIAVSYTSLKTDAINSHLEDIYIFLIQKICPDYLTFRFIVWGTALLLYGLTIKVFKIDKNIAWLCFVAVGLLWFSYARSSLAMAMMFLSFALYNADNSSFMKKILAVLLLIGSYYFHKSALFGIVLIILSSLLKKINTTRLVFLVLSLPLLYYALGVFLNQYAALDVDSDSDMWSASVNSAQLYMGRDLTISGLGLLVQQFTERATYILIACMGVKASIDKKHNIVLTNSIRALISLLVLMVIVAFMFQFDFGFNTSFIADRFFRFSFIPASLLLAYFFTNNIYPRISKVAFYLGLFASFYELFYSYYMCI